jgi:predicted DNA-binding transcriptional regulator YafY
MFACENPGMRADRLVSILMLLQARGRVTAEDLAERLEVSPRTVHRDLEALSAAGVPVYAQRGRGGGWQLVEGYRSDLSGLTEEEARALFMVAGPAAATGVDVAPAAHSALRKLLAALPAHYRPAVERDRSEMHVDPAGWWQRGERPAHLAMLRETVRSGGLLWLRYDHGDGPGPRRLVDPHGLVQKAGVWYLLGLQDGGLRTFRVSRIHDLAAAPGESQRPADFDVAAAWERSRAAFEQRGEPLLLTARVRQGSVRTVRAVLRSRLAGRSEECDLPGWTGMRMRFPGEAAAAAMLAGFADAVEVVSPDSVRERLRQIGGRLVGLYGRKGDTW